MAAAKALGENYQLDFAEILRADIFDFEEANNIKIDYHQFLEHLHYMMTDDDYSNFGPVGICPVSGIYGQEAYWCSLNAAEKTELFVSFVGNQLLETIKPHFAGPEVFDNFYKFLINEKVAKMDFDRTGRKYGSDDCFLLGLYWATLEKDVKKDTIKYFLNNYDEIAAQYAPKEHRP